MRHLALGFIFTILGAFAVVAGCEVSGSASCEESCDVPEDCASGLTCSPRGMCVPDECDACFESNDNCRYVSTTPPGELIQCSFSNCW